MSSSQNHSHNLDDFKPKLKSFATKSCNELEKQYSLIESLNQSQVQNNTLLSSLQDQIKTVMTEIAENHLQLVETALSITQTRAQIDEIYQIIGSTPPEHPSILITPISGLAEADLMQQLEKKNLTQQQHQKEMNEQEQKYDQKMIDEQKKHAKEMTQKKQNHDEEIAELRQQHDKALSLLQLHHNKEILQRQLRQYQIQSQIQSELTEFKDSRIVKQVIENCTAARDRNCSSTFIQEFVKLPLSLRTQAFKDLPLVQKGRGRVSYFSPLNISHIYLDFGQNQSDSINLSVQLCLDMVRNGQTQFVAAFTQIPFTIRSDVHRMLFHRINTFHLGILAPNQTQTTNTGCFGAPVAIGLNGFGAPAANTGGFGAPAANTGGFGAPATNTGGFGAPAANTGFCGFGAPAANTGNSHTASANIQHSSNGSLISFLPFLQVTPAQLYGDDIQENHDPVIQDYAHHCLSCSCLTDLQFEFHKLPLAVRTDVHKTLLVKSKVQTDKTAWLSQLLPEDLYRDFGLDVSEEVKLHINHIGVPTLATLATLASQMINIPKGIRSEVLRGLVHKIEYGDYRTNTQHWSNQIPVDKSGLFD